MKLNFRLTKRSDLHYFDEIRGERLPKLHLKRIQDQEENKAKYIIIFYKKKPVGHIFIRLKKDKKHKTIPIFEDIFVKKEYRGKGIGTKILDYAEKQIKLNGFNECYLDFEVQEKHLKTFYEHRGYKIIGRPIKSNLILEDKGKKVKIIYFTMKKELL